MMLSVFLVEDHYTTRQGIRLVLEKDADIKVVGEAETVEDALGPILALHTDVVVSDFSFGKRKTGAELILELHQAGCPMPVLILSGYDDPTYLRAAMAAGARGYLLKSEYGHAIVKAVKQVAQGETYYSQALVPLLTDILNPTIQLTEQEERVLRLLALGGTNQEIAQKLNLEETTIRFHLRKLFHKVKVNHRGQLMAWAWKNGYGEK